jgi:hypothetical protein
MIQIVYILYLYLFLFQPRQLVQSFTKVTGERKQFFCKSAIELMDKLLTLDPDARISAAEGEQKISNNFYIFFPLKRFCFVLFFLFVCFFFSLALDADYFWTDPMPTPKVQFLFYF